VNPNPIATLTHYIYMLLCADGSYYLGITRNVAARVAYHQTGKGVAHTRHRRPITRAYQEGPYNIKAA